MKRSESRILTTHVGSLPRPSRLSQGVSRPNTNNARTSVTSHFIMRGF